MYKGMITIFKSEDGPLTFETKKIEAGTKREVLKQVRAIMDEAMKMEDLFNIQITISKK